MTTFYKFFISNCFYSIILSIALFLLYFIIISKNPINVILFLIVFFFNLALLFIYCGADYIAVLFLSLHAGAISIILLFVVMLLDMKDLILQKEKFSKTLNLIFVGYSYLISTILSFKFYHSIEYFLPRIQYTNWITLWNEQTNIKIIGANLFEFYLFQFLIVGVFLFLIMIIIISLIINYNFISKKQNLLEQLKKKNFLYFNK